MLRQVARTVMGPCWAMPTSNALNDFVRHMGTERCALLTLSQAREVRNQRG